jgi:Leucine-rich repeat (LRR) protein
LSCKQGDYCNWYGVICTIRPGFPEGVLISLQSNNLLGQIPESWARFCTLLQLNIQNNYVSGNLPAFGSVMAFPYLTYVIMSNNMFTGPLPDYYGRVHGSAKKKRKESARSDYRTCRAGGLSMLTALGLSRNGISGPVPTSLACLQDLETLTLSHNRMTGRFPELFANSLMTWLVHSVLHFYPRFTMIFNI